ncbi:VCBS repeat-containing protein [Akkermansiaceae bacterium]|nr:VCBS repeat-containing protein [Akkermansiaceae bacterium]
MRGPIIITLMCTGILAADDEIVRLPGVDAKAEVEEMIKRADATDDAGWDSEVASSRAQVRLQELLEGGWKEVEGPKLVSLKSQSMKEIYRDGQVMVSRGEGDDVKVTWESAFQSLAQKEQKLKLKTTGVNLTGEGEFQTTIIYLAKGKGTDGAVQQNGRWELQWEEGDPLKLIGVKVLTFEEVALLTKKGLHFEDRTAAVFAGDEAFEKQLMRGVGFWRSRMMGDFGVDVNGMQGLALGDINGDDVEDLYVAQQGGLPNKMYLRQADGTLRDVLAESGLDWMEVTRGVLFVDLDNDGDQDLAMAQGWYYVLMENDGTGKFTKKAEVRAAASLHSLAAADYDLDGDLDLYFCGRNPDREKDEKSLVGLREALELYRRGKAMRR